MPQHTVFVITTDGMENASRRYDSKQVKKMITRQKEKYGWEFLFIGANIDAVETARNIGISKERASNYYATPQCTTELYDVISDVVCEVRMNKTISENWNERLVDEELPLPEFLKKKGAKK